MKGDFSRLSFNPARRYTRVLMQQGRVQLDADWNEREEIGRRLERAGLLAAIGPAGVPALTDGFAPGVTGAGDDVVLGPGVLYADGMLCESGGTSLFTQTDLPPAAVLPSGAYPGLARPTDTGRYLVYLDIWERDVNALQDPALRETALGGPDTATRTALVWQARLEPAQPTAAAEQFPPGWTPAALTGTPGRMLAATLPPGAAAGPCALPPTASYTSLSNQLYRVEVHAGGTLDASFTPGPGGAPTFKWSRDNASVVTTVTAVAGQVVTVADLGPDDVLGFGPNGVVELIDDRSELSEHRGTLLRIAVGGIDPGAGTVTIDPGTPVPPMDFSGTVLLRRWDHAWAAPGGGMAVGSGVTALEAGITVAFTPGLYRTGDWWMFAARTAIDAATGSIVWPGAPGEPLPPAGARHRYVPLALLDYNAAANSFTLVEDCRTLFAPAAGRLPGLRARFSRNNHLADLVPGQQLTLAQLGQGLMVATGAPLDITSLTPASLRLVAELPVTMNTLVPGPDTRVVGTHSIALAADIAPATANRVTVTPRQATLDLLSATLNHPLQGGSAADFARQFSVVNDPAAAPGVWRVADDGTVAQLAASTGIGALALSQTALDMSALHAGASAVAGASVGDTGLVFNWASAADYWVFYHSVFFTVIGFSGAVANMQFGLAHYAHGQLDGSPSTSGFSFAATGANGLLQGWTVDLDIAATANGLQFGARITWASGAGQTVTLPFTPPQRTVQVLTPTRPGGTVNPTTGVLATRSASLAATQLIRPTGAQSVAAELVARTALRPAASLVAAVAAAPAAAVLAATPAAAPAAATSVTTTTVPIPVPTSLASGTRIGVMTRGKGDARFTRLQWTKASDELVGAIPFGAAPPVLVRLVVKRALIRTAAEALAAQTRGVPIPPAPEPDFETAFFVAPTPPHAGYYGYGPVPAPGGLPGIGTEQL